MSAHKFKVGDFVRCKDGFIQKVVSLFGDDMLVVNDLSGGQSYIFAHNATLIYAAESSGKQTTFDEWKEKVDSLPYHYTLEDPPPETAEQARKRRWREEGRCPDCGELGKFHLSAMVCSTHGVYK